MKKVAIIVFDITKRAGTERAVCNLANLLADSRKYEVTIISIHSTYGKAAYDIKDDILLIHLGLSQFKNKVARLRLYSLTIKKINQICKEKKIDVVIGTTHGINIILALLKKSMKTVVCEHTCYMTATLIARILRRLVYPFLDAVVVLTNSDAKFYSFHKDVKVIPNSQTFQSEKQSDLTNKKILAVGRLSHLKGFDLLIDAIYLFRNEYNGWKIKIIGSGENEDILKKKIERLELGKLIMLCPSTNNIIQEYLQASIFVLSSRSEGFGLVIIEAQSCGLPVVSFDCPSGPAEIIKHNENGLLVENGNIVELSQSILELMYNQDKRIHLGKNALENINKYKPEKIFELWDKLLDIL